MGAPFNVSETLPLFVTVAVTDALVEPTKVSANVTGRGVTRMLGADAAVPVAVKVAEALAVVEEKVTVPDSAPTMEGVTMTGF